MATELRYPKGHVFFDGNAAAAALGSLEWYHAGTTTPQTVYADKDESTPLPNPLTLDPAGRAVDSGGDLVAVYFSDSSGNDAKEVLKDSIGATVYTDDEIPKPVDPTEGLSDFSKPLTQWSTDTASSVDIGTSDLGRGRLADTSSNSITYSLPSASAAGNGKGIAIKKTAAANSVTLDGDGSETIDGRSDFTFRGNGRIVEVVSDGANWRIRNHLFGAMLPQGYLTLVSGTPVITSDQASATTVYYTPDKGNLIPFVNGPAEFSELSLSLVSQHTADTIYDIFAFFDDGTLRIGTGPAWDDSSAGSGSRGTGAGTTELERINGLFTNAVEITARNGASTYTVAANEGTYLGSIFMDDTNGQVTCHRSFGQDRKWGLWNAYNRRNIVLKVGDSTASWSYSSSSYRPSNDDSSNSGTVFAGLAEELFSAEFVQNVGDNGNGDAASKVGIGWDSTSSISGASLVGGYRDSANDNEKIFAHMQARYVSPPQIGISIVTCLEQRMRGSQAALFLGGNDDMEMSIQWMG